MIKKVVAAAALCTTGLLLSCATSQKDVSAPTAELSGSLTVSGLKVKSLTENSITLSWTELKKADAVGLKGYRIYWADKNTPNMNFLLAGEVDAKTTSWTFNKKTFRNYYFKVSAVYEDHETDLSSVVKSDTKAKQNVKLEKLDRGFVAFNTGKGMFLSWRLFASEVNGFSDTGLKGKNFALYRNGEKLAVVSDSTNYFDKFDKNFTKALAKTAKYEVIPLDNKGNEINSEKETAIVSQNPNYIEIPMQIPPVTALPADMVLTANANYSYVPQDISIGDVDGDGAYEYIVRWDPTNAKDVSQKGYTGKTYIDCYKLDGTLLWRIDMGINLRSGAHYNCFAVADVNGDGKAEIALQTAPGTKVTKYNSDGSVKSEKYITLPADDVAAGITHNDNYCFSASDYKEYFTQEIMHWGDWTNDFWKKNSNELNFANATKARSRWDKNIENLWEPMYTQQQKEAPKQLVGHEGPYSREEAEKLADFFYTVVAPYKNESRNKMNENEGFIVSGPEYITIFSGEGEEYDTQHIMYPREDDGLLWGDFQWNRVETANRSERHNAGAAYLDGENLYFVLGRGYYTRSTIATYTLDAQNKIKPYWGIDSGWVEMTNPFFWVPGTNDTSDGNIPEAAEFAGQGDHSICFADVDGDGCQEIIYGGAIVNNDGKLLSSAKDHRPSDNALVKLGHGDALHCTDINPDRPGLEIFSCFEGGKGVPFGSALRDAETNTTIFGDYSGKDTGRCMIGDILPNVRGLETWSVKRRAADGSEFEAETLGTNQNIRWAADMSTSIYVAPGDVVGLDKAGAKVVQLAAASQEGMASNNGTKGNACLIADVLGDWREELIVRKADNSAIRVYMNTDVTPHKLYTLVQNPQYRAQVSAQQSAYNQPSYPDFYLASDTDWEYVWVPNKN